MNNQRGSVFNRRKGVKFQPALTEGLPDKEISHRLVISERTVHHHVSAILSKIGVTSRSAAAREAARMGIGTPIEALLPVNRVAAGLIQAFSPMS